MSVRVLTVHDVIDLYHVRKVIERGAVPPAPQPSSTDRPGGERRRAAASEADWQSLGTANIHFHQALVALAGSPRLADLMRGILAELRLVFHVMADPRRFHEPYLARNREILTRIQAGDAAGADQMLAEYLADAERQLVDAYAAKTDQS